MERLYVFVFDKQLFQMQFSKDVFFFLKTETLEVKLPEKGRCFDVQIPGAKQEHGKEKTEGKKKRSINDIKKEEMGEKKHLIFVN